MAENPPPRRPERHIYAVPGPWVNSARLGPDPGEDLLATAPGVQVSDEERLAQLGYKQELERRMSGFQNFAISFTIISILSGALTLYGTGLNYGGPMQQAIGWPIVSLFVLIVALSMAELASAFPTAGGL